MERINQGGIMNQEAGLPAPAKADEAPVQPGGVFDYMEPLPKQPTYRPREWEQETTR